MDLDDEDVQGAPTSFLHSCLPYSKYRLMDFLFTEYRLDWFGAGPSSPNKTGALLAIFFVAAWWPALRWRRGFWLSLGLAFAAAVFLLQTESRGALVAAGAGLVLVVGGSGLNRLNTLKGRLMPGVSFWGRTASIAVLLVVLLFYSQQLGVNDRMTTMTSGDDESANVRVALYSAGLQMIAAAPQGWGTGQAGDAYGQWYQEIGDNRSYLSLVNSHLTWMAEGGMLFQFLYIAGWCLMLMLCWPVPWTPLRASAFALWVTLWLCGLFSSVLPLVWLWLIPCGLLFLCLLERFQLGQWPARRQWLFVTVAAVAGMAGLHSAGYVIAGGDRLAIRSGSVALGERPERVAVYQPDQRILGDKYGHTIRSYLDALGGCTVLYDEPARGHLPSFERVVLSGSASLAGLSGFKGHLVWMNPPAEVEEGALQALEARSLTVVLGGLGNWRRMRSWQSLAEGNPSREVIELPGVADFIPDWPRYLEPSTDADEPE